MTAPGHAPEKGWLAPSISEQERSFQERTLSFVDTKIVARAHQFDAERAIPSEIFAAAGEAGVWAAAVPKAFGGLGANSVSLGLIAQELGRGSASLLSLFTVHAMVCAVLQRWGKPDQKERWLPRLAAGDLRASLALSEPQSGSDAGNLQTRIERTEEGFVLNGEKVWISGGLIADLILIIGAVDGKATAILVETDRAEGLHREAMMEPAGFQAAHAARLRFIDCLVPNENLLGRVGFGLSLAAGYGLDLGRLCIAFGAVGVCQDCLEHSASFAQRRETFGKKLEDQPLIQRLITLMVSDTVSTQLVCHQAARARDSKGVAMDETGLAKYHAAAAAQRVTDNALHIFAAQGLESISPIQRHWRDARVFGIIEGSVQLQESLLGKHAIRSYSR